MARSLSKAPGITVLPRRQRPESLSLLAAVLDEDPWRADVPWPVGFAGGLAHRLDVPTSGVVLLADDLAELHWLRDLFARHVLHKTYLFESARDVPWDRSRCDLPLAHDRRHRGRMVVQRGRSTPHRGRWFPAETELQRVDGHLWAATMRTGVTHQIRVHAAFLGLALAGDRRYGGGPPLDGPASFRLHHVGLRGPGLRTDPVPLPGWASRWDPGRLL